MKPGCGRARLHPGFFVHRRIPGQRSSGSQRRRLALPEGNGGVERCWMDGRCSDWARGKVGRLEYTVWPEKAGGTLELHLTPTRKWMRCEQCGHNSRQGHETTIRRVRDLPIFEHRVVLVVPRRRLWCERCGSPRLERLSRLSRHAARCCGVGVWPLARGQLARFSARCRRALASAPSRSPLT